MPMPSLHQATTLLVGGAGSKLHLSLALRADEVDRIAFAAVSPQLDVRVESVMRSEADIGECNASRSRP